MTRQRKRELLLALSFIALGAHQVHAQPVPPPSIPSKMLGQPNGPAKLDASGTLSSNTVIPTGKSTAQALADVAATAANAAVNTDFRLNNTLLRPVSTRAAYSSDGGPTTNPNFGATSRYFETLPVDWTPMFIEVCYDGYNFGQQSGTNATEADIAAPFPITSGIEVQPLHTINLPFSPTSVNGILKRPLFFNRQRQVTITPGVQTCSDLFYYPWQQQESYYINTFYNPASFQIIYNRQPLSVGGTSAFETTNSHFFNGVKASTSTTPVSTFTAAIALPTSGGFALPLAPFQTINSPGICMVGIGLTGSICDDGSGHFPSGNGLATGSTITYSTGAVTVNATTTLTPNNITFSGYSNFGAAPVDDTLTAPGTNMVSHDSGYGPSSVVGVQLPGLQIALAPRLCAAGDSEDFGHGNAIDSSWSWINYAANGRSVLKVAQVGETAASFASIITSIRRLSSLAGKCDYIIDDYGTNDLANIGVTLSQMQARKSTIWAYEASLLPLGNKGVFPAGMFPRTVTGSDTTPYNSNYGAGNTLWNQLNAWTCAQGQTVYGGFEDIAYAVSVGPGTCTGTGLNQWIAGKSDDKTHPNGGGYQNVGADLAPGGLHAAKVFALTF